MEVFQSRLQSKVISYGRQSVVGCAIIGVAVFTVGIFAVVGLFVFEDGDVEDDNAQSPWHLLCYMCLGLTLFSIYGYFYGQHLKVAAEDRNIRKLKILAIIWATFDLIFVVGVFAIVLVFYAFQFLIVLVAAAVDAYRLRIIWKFIRECKECNKTYSA